MGLKLAESDQFLSSLPYLCSVSLVGTQAPSRPGLLSEQKFTYSTRKKVTKKCFSLLIEFLSNFFKKHCSNRCLTSENI